MTYEEYKKELLLLKKVNKVKENNLTIKFVNANNTIMKDINKLTEDYQKQLFLSFLEWAGQADLNCSYQNLWSVFKEMYLEEQCSIKWGTASTQETKPKIIFTNCIGETFTEEDLVNNVEVWWASLNPLWIRYGEINSIECACKKFTTDIFRSKKSLLKYLYEMCE